jgi:hypothetical protein
MNGERMKTQKDDEMQKYTYKDDSSMQVWRRLLLFFYSSFFSGFVVSAAHFPFS